MEDGEFFDLLYSQWAKTTGAEDKYWMSEADDEEPDFFNVYAVDHEQNKTPVAVGMSEADADFVSGVHGCLADLIRRLHTAIDEADRLDYRVDEQEGRIAELEMDASDYREIIADLGEQLDRRDLNIADLEAVLEKLDQDLIKANADVEYWKNEAHSHDWRNR